jgi:hypothetical protein
LRGQKAGVRPNLSFRHARPRQLSTVCKKKRVANLPAQTPRSALTLLAPPLPTVRAHPRPLLRPAFRRSATASAGSAINVRAPFRCPPCTPCLPLLTPLPLPPCPCAVCSLPSLARASGARDHVQARAVESDERTHRACRRAQSARVTRAGVRASFPLTLARLPTLTRRVYFCCRLCSGECLVRAV